MRCEFVAIDKRRVRCTRCRWELTVVDSSRLVVRECTGQRVFIWGNNLLMLGPSGSGKPMAKRVPTVLPSLAATESIETTRIYSAMGHLQPDQPLMAKHPLRSPHHTISDAALVGGCSLPTPGEISLSHNGVLLGSFANLPPAMGA